MHTSCGVDIQAEAAQRALLGSRYDRESTPGGRVLYTAQNSLHQLDHAAAAIKHKKVRKMTAKQSKSCDMVIAMLIDL